MCIDELMRGLMVSLLASVIFLLLTGCSAEEIPGSNGSNKQSGDYLNTPGNDDDAGDSTIIVGGAIPDGSKTGIIYKEPILTDICGKATIEPVVKLIPGNLMVIFDRSMSMNEFFESTTRLNAAYYAVLNGLQPFMCEVGDTNCKEQLNVAAILLPSAPGGVGACYVEDITSPQQINWMGATQFAAAWKTYWNASPDPNPLILVFGTPITSAFQRAAEAIQGASLPGRTAVLFITDGLGTCNQGTPAEVQAASWFAESITTHVVSVYSQSFFYPGGDGQLFNDSVASAGGTGQSINPSNVSSLNAALSDIMQSAATAPSCEVTLEGGKLNDLYDACKRGTVTVNGELIVCDQQNKTDGFWVKSADQIELVGSACNKLKAQGQLSATFPCDLIIPG